MQDARQIGEALPPGTANTLPVMHRGCAGCYPGLCLCDLDTVSLGVLLQYPQALLGLFKVPFGLPQATEDGQRIALGQVMAQVKQVRDAHAAQTVWASLIRALARSLTRYRTSVPKVVRQSLARAYQVAKLRSAVTSSINK